MSETKESFVPKILSDYYQNSRTGILTLKQKSIHKTIHIENGNIVFATTNIETEQLGKRLLEWGILTTEQLVATDKLAQENRRFGKSLIELGFFQAEELPELFYRQAAKIIYSTFSWQHFDFRFTRCALPEYEIKSSISIPQTLIEGIRYLEDISLINQHLSNLAAPLKLNLPLAAIYQVINPDSQERCLLSKLDNIVFKTEEILKLTDIPQETIIKILCTLNLLGMLKQSERVPSLGFANAQINSLLVETKKPIEITPSSQQSQNQPVTKINTTPNLSSSIFTSSNVNPAIPTNIFDNIALDSRSVMMFCYEIETKLRSINSGASLYEVLEVDNNASSEEINTSYQRLSKHFHPNRQLELSVYNTDLSSNLHYISTSISQAYEILKSRQPLLKATQNTSTTTASKTTSSTSNKVLNIPKLAPNLPKSPNQQEIMEFCYLIENKLNMIRGEVTHYQVLELERSASREVIDQAYHQLMLKFDVKKQENLSVYGLNMSGQLEEISKAIRLAAEVLRDPYKKQLYDERTGLSPRKTTGQYAALSQPSQIDSKQPITPQSSRIDPKYPNPLTLHSSPLGQSDARYNTLQNKTISNPGMPPLTTDSKMRTQQPNAINPLSNSTISPNPALNNSSTTTKIPTNTNPTGIPAINRNSGVSDLGRSNPNTKPSITIDPTRNSLPSFTPVAASKAIANPTQPALTALPVLPPVQTTQPAQPNNLAPTAKTISSTPFSELPQANRPTPGGKGKTFTATEYYLRSIELCDKQKYTDAIESLLMALKLSPRDGEYWAQLARAYSNIEGYEKDTLAAYQKANEYSPREYSYLLELGDFLRKHGYRQKAAEVYSGVLTLRPQNSKAQLALAELARESKENENEDTKSKGFWSKWLKQS